MSLIGRFVWVGCSGYPSTQKRPKKTWIGTLVNLNTLPLAFARLESIDCTDRLAPHYWIYDRQR